MQVTTPLRAARPRSAPGARPLWHNFGSHPVGVSLVKVAVAGLCAYFALGVPLACAQAQKNPPLVAQDAWIRATPGTVVAAAYLTLHNQGSSPVTVTGVQSPMAESAMIHETRVQGGQSQMRPHEQIVVAPGATVKLQPGGLHVMLQGLKQPLAVGESVPLIITLAGGETLQVSAAVRPLNAE
jgi:periplasmic copper chaperone A